MIERIDDPWPLAPATEQQRIDAYRSRLREASADHSEEHRLRQRAGMRVLRRLRRREAALIRLRQMRQRYGD